MKVLVFNCRKVLEINCRKLLVSTCFLQTHLLLWGNAYSQIIRNGKSEVVALYPLMPDRMKVDRDEQGYRWISSVGFKNDGWWRLSSLPVFLLKLYEYSYIMYNGLLYGGVR